MTDPRGSILGVLVALWSGLAVASADRGCSDTMLKAAEGAVDHVKSWRDVYYLYAKYAPCDKGGDFAEGLSNDVVHLLATQWSELRELNHLVSKHARFRQFVLRHIDATADSKDLATIVELSASNCSIPASLCGAIHHDAQRALVEAQNADAHGLGQNR